MPEMITWTDVEEIGIQLYEAHRQIDPLTVRFTQLRQMVQALPGFESQPGHNVNESILEAIQAAWYEEFQEPGQEHDEDELYTPPTPFRPEH